MIYIRSSLRKIGVHMMIRVAFALPSSLRNPDVYANCSIYLSTSMIDQFRDFHQLKSIPSHDIEEHSKYHGFSVNISQILFNRIEMKMMERRNVRVSAKVVFDEPSEHESYRANQTPSIDDPIPLYTAILDLSTHLINFGKSKKMSSRSETARAQAHGYLYKDQ